jgi:hypothetical protein
MADKRYVGSGRKNEQYDITNISVCLSDINKEDIKTGKNGKKYLSLSVGARKQPDEYGKTHSVWIDDYVAEDKAGVAPKKAAPQLQEADLPF